MKEGWLLFIVALVFSSLNVHAQQSASNPLINPVYTYKLTVENGLSQSNANAVVKDDDGFVWIATDDGLNRFDGYTFKIFKPRAKDSTSIGNNQIRKLFIDSKGRLWTGTILGGLSLYNKKSETFKQYKNILHDTTSLSNNSIVDIVEDNDKNLWIGTHFGLNKFDPETGTSIHYFNDTTDASNFNNVIYALNLDRKKDKLYVGTERGISIIDLHTNKISNFFNDQQGRAFNRVISFYTDKFGRLWFGTYGQGLYMFTEADHTFIRFVTDINNPHSISANVIRKIISYDDQVLVGTDGGGICTLNIDTFEFARLSSKNDPSFLNAAVYDLYEDNNKILWIGTYGGGIKQINRNRKDFVHYEVFYPDMMKLGRNSVLALAEDHDKNIWIGTDGAGLYKFNPFTKQFTQYTHQAQNMNSLTGNVVKSLLVDTKGNIYAGTFATGLNYINTRNNTITRYVHTATPNSLPHNSVWALYQDSKERIWVGTFGGLCEFVPATNQFILTYTRYEDQRTITAFKIFEDRDENLWFGTRDNGLFELRKGSKEFERFQSPEHLTSSEIRDINQDEKGTLWVSTMNGGLNYKAGEATSFKPFKNIIQKDLVSMLEDEKHNFWIGTFHGLLKYDAGKNITRVYDVNDGLQGNEFNYDSKLKASTGDFYFGGLNGLTVFKPANIGDNASAPPVVINNILLFHKEVAIGDQSGILQESANQQQKIILQPSQNVISIEYAAADFTYPKKNLYAYILEGFDRDWNYVGSQRNATYTNLPPGAYTFKIKATNNDGVWAEDFKSLHIKVLSPWYKMQWVQFLLVIALVVIVIIIIQVRTQFLLKQQNLLKVLVERRTNQIELQKSEIEDKSMLLEKAHEEIMATNEELIEVNTKLEKLVGQRTLELRKTLHKLIETDQDLDTFLYRSSHDLRGPITTLMGLAQLAKSENNQPHIESYFDKINSSCVHMLKLLKKLNETNLIFRASSHVVRINWMKILTEVQHELSGLDVAHEVKISIHNTIEEDVFSDEHLLSVIIVNLMENGIVFKGVENCYLNLSLYTKNNVLHIEVKDNGIGIQDAIKDNVFGMFYRGSEKSIGNGLGLFLVQKSVELLKGSITIESEPYVYTTIKVKIPVAPTTSPGTSKELL